MSGFVAVVHWDGRPVTPELLAKLGGAVAYRGPDGGGTWAQGGFGAVCKMFRATFSCAGDHQPVVTDDGLVLVCDARIDDRDQLSATLRSRGFYCPADAPASAFILAAYRAWGSDAPAHLKGDFAFVLWDSASSRVFVARDPFGMRWLYMAPIRDGVVISNDANGILTHPDVPRDLDPVALGDFLLFGRVNAIDHDRTGYLKIRRIRAATCGWLGRDTTKTTAYWALPEGSDAFAGKDPGSICEAFLTTLRSAVRDRIQGPSVVCLLSGGLDSTTISALAAQCRDQGHGPDSLIALTAVVGQEDPEGALANELARRHEIPHRLRRIRIEPPMTRWTKTPFPNANLYSYHEGNYRLTARLGRIALHGLSADHIMSPEAGYPRTRGRHPPSMIFLSRRLIALIRTRLGLRFGIPDRPVLSPPFPDWLSKQFCSDFALEDRWTSYWRPNASYANAIRPFAARRIDRQPAWGILGETYPLSYTPSDQVDPFLDSRVLDIALSLPGSPWFEDKYLLRSAGRALLPLSILNRPKTNAGPWLRHPVPDEAWPPTFRSEMMPQIINIGLLARAQPKAGALFPVLLDRWLVEHDNVKG